MSIKHIILCIEVVFLAVQLIMARAAYKSPLKYGETAKIVNILALIVILLCNIAIRKLTPKECFRLQGWTDEYFEKAAFVNSDSQLYKQAGNGVTVNVIEAIAKQLKFA